MRREIAIWTLGLIWIALIAAGLWVWEEYDSTAGGMGPTTLTAAATPIKSWQLNVFAHPHCPCTRATLSELAEILRRAPGLSSQVWFVRPAGMAHGWERGESWDTAARIPGVTVVTDPDGAEARRYGAKISGQAVLTGPTGQIEFRGGLTKARGRGGENSGRRAVLAWVEDNAGPTSTPVFGCDLFSPVM